MWDTHTWCAAAAHGSQQQHAFQATAPSRKAPSRRVLDNKLTKNFADAGVVHVGTGLQDGTPLAACPHHERVHRTLDMLLLLLLVMRMLLKMLLG